MAIPTFDPKITITLLKMVGRRDGVAERYDRALRTQDLTPLLGKNGSVRVTKGVHRPEGSFTISFDDALVEAGWDTAYALIEPMDVIEIRAARRPDSYVGGPLPLLMRGFVSDVKRSEAMDEGGPQRRVIITGQDAGRFWLVHHVIWELAQLLDQPYLDAFRMQAASGVEVQFLPVSDYMRQLAERVINKKVEALPAFSTAIVRPFKVRATVPEGYVSPQRGAGMSGAVWDLVRQFQDAPWNEAFVEDVEEDGPGTEVPTLIFRPAPYRDVDGQFIMPGATDPGTLEVDDSVLPSLDVTRSDRNVANFFHVPPGASLLEDGARLDVWSLTRGEPLDFDPVAGIYHPNNDPRIYGVRKMTEQTSLLPGDAFQGGPVVIWHEHRREQLRLMNRDNAVFEDGGITMQGHEGAKPGRYLRVRRGGLRTTAYMEEVSHSFLPLQGWSTNARLVRGDGFLTRLRHPVSPYLEEIGRGPYGGPASAGRQP